MDIHIFGHQTLRQFLAGRPGEYDVLVVTDSEVAMPKFVPQYGKEFLHLSFDDRTAPLEGFRVAEETDIEQALVWSRGREQLAIACHAGISRSSALAYLIGCCRSSPEEAIQLLDRSRHSPNRLVLSLGSKLLDDPGVLRVFEEWKGGSDW